MSPDNLGALCIALTPQEADNKPVKDLDGCERHHMLVGIGFCEKRPRGSAGQHRKLVETRRPWSKGGVPGEYFVDMRDSDMNHNDEKLPYANMSMVWHFDNLTPWTCPIRYAELPRASLISTDTRGICWHLPESLRALSPSLPSPFH